MVFRYFSIFTVVQFSVIDSDGEFLLIEAAESLPNWANPDNCDQRVIISDYVIVCNRVTKINS